MTYRNFKIDPTLTPDENLEAAMEVGMFEFWSKAYVEPGYDAGEKGIIFADWNNPDHYDEATKSRVVDSTIMSELSTLAEANGWSIEWSDEWSTCDECGNAYRTHADCYSWTSAAFDGVCRDCLQKDPVDYLEKLEGNSEAALNNSIGIDPELHGYVKLDTGRLENGFHEGQDDDPKAISKTLDKAGVEHYFFAVDDIGQFDIRFSVWVIEEEVEAAQEAFDTGITKAAVSPAALAKASLAQAAKALEDIEDPSLVFPDLSGI